MRTSSGSKKIVRDAVSSHRQVIREVDIQNHKEQVNRGQGQQYKKTAVLRTSVLSHPPPPCPLILKMSETEFLGAHVISNPV